MITHVNPEDNQAPTQRTLNFKAMGSACRLWFYHKDPDQLTQALEACQQEAQRFETCYSRYLKDSVIGRLNQGFRIRVDHELAALLNYADQAYQQSDGLFDITSGILRQAWDFHGSTLPSTSHINALKTRVGWHKVLEHNHIELNNTDKIQQFSKHHFSLPPQMEIDLGGIVKEYAADSLRSIASEYGIKHGLIDLAGDIVVIGPHPDGSPWKICIQHPRNKQGILANISLAQGAIASSGDYERFMLVNGQRYCHIINPKTGWPVQGICAVSVVAPACVIAGTLATTAMLLGKEQADEYLKSSGLPYLLKSSLPESHKPSRT